MNEQETYHMISMAYDRSQECDPITIKNIWFVIRHPIFTLRMLWFAAGVLGILKIDKEHLDKVFGRKNEL